MSTLIRNGRVIDPGSDIDATLDVRVEGDRIAEIASGLAPNPGDEVIDAAQLALQVEHWRQQVAEQFEALGASAKASRRQAERLLASLYGYLSLARLGNDPKIFRRGVKQLRRELKAL